MSNKNIIIGLVILIAVGSLVYLGLSSSARYAYSVGELVQNNIEEQQIRVQGIVSEIEYTQGGRLSRFFLYDEHNPEIVLSVIYQGESTPPDTFRDGSGATVEGYYEGQGIFIAHTILPLCASHYEPELEGN